MPLVIQSRVVSGVTILDLKGRLWILDLPLREEIGGLLSDGRRRFVLNISGVDYIDSSGLGQLVSIWTSIKNRDGHMTLLGPTARVRKLFEITRLHTIFDILEQEGDAVKAAAK
jgi:anti-sigma B factor antagonist